MGTRMGTGMGMGTGDGRAQYETGMRMGMTEFRKGRSSTGDWNRDKGWGQGQGQGHLDTLQGLGDAPLLIVHHNTEEDKGCPLQALPIQVPVDKPPLSPSNPVLLSPSHPHHCHPTSLHPLVMQLSRHCPTSSSPCPSTCPCPRHPTKPCHFHHHHPESSSPPVLIIPFPHIPITLKPVTLHPCRPLIPGDFAQEQSRNITLHHRPRGFDPQNEQFWGPHRTWL